MKFIITYTLVILSCLASFGATATDSVKVYFRQGYRVYDPKLANNGASMDAFVNCVREAMESGNLEHIEVSAYASPEGQNAANERLAANRCESIINYIKSATGISPSLIHSQPGGVAWGELRSLVESHPEVPSRIKVLDILDNTPLWIYDAKGRIVSGRKKQLMDLDGGRPYNWMYAHLFPELRNTVAVTLYTLPDEPETPALEEPSDTAVAVWESVQEEPVYEPIEEPAEIIIPTDDQLLSEPIALKTNLLYYGVLMPNLEVEWMINPRWSVSLEGDVAWWSRKSRERFYRLAVISPEARRWIHPKSTWHGMYVGAFAGGLWYDLADGHKGYKGEGGMAGLSFGYMWPLSRHISMEAAIGAGYLFTRYKEYRPYEGHYLYERTKNTHYFGPLKLKLSLVWRINTHSKPMKINSAL